MVALFTGLGPGFERGSGAALGGVGLLGSGTLGRGGEGVFVNAASGNLVITRQDEFLAGRGPDVGISRTYNSLGALADDNNDQWRQSTDRRVFGLAGTVNTTGSTVKRAAADGSEITYEWDAAGYYQTTDGAGAYDRLTHASNVWTWTDGDSQVTETYGAYGTDNWRITGQADADGNSLTFTYSGAKLTRVTTADGDYVEYAWTGNNLTEVRTVFKDFGAGNAVTTHTRTRYGYDASNRLTSVTIDRSPQDNLVSDGNTYVTTYTYDGSTKRVKTIAQTDGSSVEFTYVSYGGAQRIKDIIQTAAAGVTRTTTLSYGSGSTQVTDPSGKVTTLFYDADGRLTQVTAPPAQSGALAQNVYFAYDANGNVTDVTDAAGKITSYQYDARGNVKKITDPNGDVVDRAYDADNNLIKETRTASSGDSAGELQAWRYIYDNENHLRYEITAEGHVTEHVYAANGQRTKTIRYAEAAYILAASANNPGQSTLNNWRTALDQRNNKTTEYVYDARGNLTSSRQLGFATTAGAADTSQGYREVFYTYDQGGRLLTRRTDTQATETFVYDGLGRLVSSIDLAGGTTSIVFNDAASTTVVTNSTAGVVTSIYNKAGELISETVSGGAFDVTGTSTYAYDKNGRLRVATDATGRKTYYLYDFAGRKIADITGGTGNNTGLREIVEYRYDANNRLVASVRYANRVSESLLAQLDNPDNTLEIAGVRPAARTEDIWQWSVYDDAGRVIETILGDGSVTKYDYDDSGRIVATIGYVNKLTTAQRDAFKIAAPTALTLPTANAAGDRLTRTFYDGDGRVIGSLDALGYLTAITYNEAGEKVRETAYDNLTNSTLRATGTFDALLASITLAPSKDVTTRYVYDGQGLLRFTVDALSQLTEFVYFEGAANQEAAVGLVRKTVSFAAALPAQTAYDFATVNAAAAPMRANAANRISHGVYNAKGQLAYSIASDGALTRFVYEINTDRVSRTIQYASLYLLSDDPPVATPTEAALNTWAGANAANARITRHYYSNNGLLRFTVDAEGYVSRVDYDAAGRKTVETRWSNKITANDGTTITQINTAANGAGASIASEYAYDYAGRLERIVAPDGTLNYFGYRANGTQTWEIRALGSLTDESRTLFAYDEAGRKSAEFRYESDIDNFSQIVDAGTGLPVNSATVLSSTQRLTSPNGEYDLTLTREGQLRFYHDGELIWANGYREQVAGASYQLVAQTNGNLVIKRIVSGQADVVIWQTSTSTSPSGPTFIMVGDDGNFTFNKGTGPANNLGYIWGTNAVTIGQEGDPYEHRYADTRYAYDGLGNLISVTDARGNITTYKYDKLGRVTEQKDALNNTVKFEYDAFGQVTKTTDARLAVTLTAYDRAGRVISVTDALNAVTTTSYTAFGEVKDVTRAGAKTQFEYDRLGRVTRTLDAEGEGRPDPTGYFETYAYNAFGARTSFVNKLGGETKYTYDLRGLLISEELPVKSVNANGAVSATNIINRFEYDSRGNRTKLIEASGFNSGSFTEERITIFEYDHANRLVRTIGENIAAFSDRLDNSSTSTAPVEETFYDQRGNVIERRNPLGARTLYFYDNLNRVTHQLSALGSLTRYFYDGNGNVIEERAYETLVGLPADAKGAPPDGGGVYRLTTYVYDAVNRLTEVNVPSVQTATYGTSLSVVTGTLTTNYDYDGVGNLIRTTDPRGSQTYYYYDNLGRRIAQVDAELYLTAYVYDANGNVTKETRYWNKLPSNPALPLGGTPPSGVANLTLDRVTDFTYDKNGRRLTEARTGVVVFNGVNVSGEPVTATVTATISYAYNGLGLVTRKTEATGDITDYTYDVSGRLTREVRAGFTDHLGATVHPTVDYYYNGLNDVTRTRQVGTAGVNGSAERVTRNYYLGNGFLNYSEDALGNQRYRDYDVGGRVVRERYTRQASGGATFNEAIGYAYDLEGRVVEQGVLVNSGAWTYDNSQIVKIHYNAFGDVTERGVSGVPLNPVLAERFEYDLAGRVWRSTAGDGVFKYYLYDGAGNQTVEIKSAGANIENQSLTTVLNYWGADRSKIATDNVAGVIATITSYDKRNQAVSVREPRRELGGSVADLTTTRSYNAFGEVAFEIDARNSRIDYTYNNSGRRIKAESPTVSVTSESGAVTSVRPTEEFYYDRSGRFVARKDANGNLTQQTLLAGTGYDGSEALIAVVTTDDGKTVTTGYDIHGDARKITDQIGRITTQTFDALGRVTQVNHPGRAGNELIDYYAYDLLGQRIEHWTNQPTSTNGETIGKEVFAYDHQGRVISQRSFGGDVTEYEYEWVSGLNTTGHGAFGGWRQTTTYVAANNRTLVEEIDIFGRVVKKTDLAGLVTNYEYDKAGRQTKTANVGAAQDDLTYAYFNTGRVNTINTTGWRQTYAYDAGGNLLTDRFDRLTGSTVTETQRNVAATYDALGRVTQVTDTGLGTNATAPLAKTNYTYDANGNIRSTVATFRSFDNEGDISAGNTSLNYWYRYDSLNRVVTSKGQLSGGQIVRGLGGVDIMYDDAGQREQTLTSFWDTAIVPRNVYEDLEWKIKNVPHNFINTRRETQIYDDAGRLHEVHVGVGTYTEEYLEPSTGYVIPPGIGTKRAEFTYDRTGRLTLQKDFEADGDAAFERTLLYNAKGQVTTDTSITLRTNTYYRSITTNGYGSGATYALGAVDFSTTTNAERTGPSGSWTTKPTSSIDNNFLWRDGALIQTVTHDPDTGSSGTPWTSTYNYNRRNDLNSVVIADGRPRTVNYITDLGGQIVQRKETITATPSGPAPFERHTRFGGKELGTVGNNGGYEGTYTSSIDERQTAPGTGNFANGATSGTFFADFSKDVSAITSFGQGSASGVYTVRGGESLSQIASELWGDSSLWYKLAEANGLTGEAALAEGQTLVIPTGVIRNTHNAGTFEPYDPNSAIGDTSPTNAKPPKKAKCGVFGQILLVVIAVAVTVASQGSLGAFFGGLFGAGGAAGGAGAAAAGAAAAGTAGAAAGASLSAAAIAGNIVGGAIAGALGSAVSQGVGVLTGIQDKFSFKGVALAAIGGGVGGGFSKAFQSLGKVGGAIARGATSSAVTQGIGVATGLQSKFSFAGVAGAALGAGLAAQFDLPSFSENRSIGNLAANLGANTASGIVNAATRSLVEGTSFGDNILAALPDIIGGTIGSAIGGEVSGQIEARRLARRTNALGNLDGASGASRDQLRAAAELSIKLDALGANALSTARSDPDALQALLRAAEVVADPLNNDAAFLRGTANTQNSKKAAVDLITAFGGAEAGRLAAAAVSTIPNTQLSDIIESPLPPIGESFSDEQKTGFQLLAAGVDVLSGTGRAAIGISDAIDRKPLLRYSLLALEIAAGPATYLLGQVIAASPAGDFIGNGVAKTSSHIANSLLSVGVNPETVFFASVGAVALGTLAFGATKAIKYVRQTADEIANLRTPLAPEFSDFDISLFDGKNVPLINQGKQGKHILGNNNFETGKSVLTADPKALALQAGSGIPVNAVPRGQAGFKERVNFGEVIGDYVFQGTSQPTTNGIIVYDKAGTIHIIPSRPN